MEKIKIYLFSCATICNSLNVAVAETETGIREWIIEVTEALPVAPPVTLYERETPLAPGALSYAHFFWMVDRFAGNCHHIDRRSNIEMLNPRTALMFQVNVAMFAGHPDHSAYLDIIRTVDTFYNALGENTFCPLVYRLWVR